MSVNLQLERRYDQIELVQGPGSRRHGKLCIMSFVAYLAGEHHTDHPRTASSFVRNFAIRLNDGVTSALRQELKPFAPRIIGTNDGRDFERTDVVYRTIIDEVVPRLTAELSAAQSDERAKPWSKSLFLFDAGWGAGGTSSNIPCLIHNIRVAHDTGDCLLVGTLAGHIFAVVARDAPSSPGQRWYWAKALELLDRLCEIGAEDRTATMPADRLQALPTPADARAGRPKPAAPAKRGIPRLWQVVRDLVAA